MTWTSRRAHGLIRNDDTSGGYLLYSAVRGRHAWLVDADGRTVHTWHHPEGIQHLKLLPNGLLRCHSGPAADADGFEKIGGNAGVLFDLDADSNVVWEYRNRFLHHDYQELPDGNLLLLATEKLPASFVSTVQGGWSAPDDPDWMWGDVVLTVSRAGDVVDTWRARDHLSVDHAVKCPMESRKEWMHANSLELTPDGHWLMSFRLTDTVALIDGADGHVRWRFGPGVFSHQHHATWLANGNVLVFDNGVHRRERPSFSQIVEFDPVTREVVWTYKADPILAFFSFMISGAERLPNGNTHITEGATGRMFEVDPEGCTVWEYVSPWLMRSRFGGATAVFRSYRIPEGDERLTGLDLDPERFAELDARTAAGEYLTVADEPMGLPEGADERYEVRCLS